MLAGQFPITPREEKIETLEEIDGTEPDEISARARWWTF